MTMGDFETPREESPRPGVFRLDALDGLRGLACLLVYFTHLGQNLRLGPLVVLGFTGVQIFFVLSGFLMFSPFVSALLGKRPMPDWRSYAIRRFTRIYPPYFVALVLFTAMRHVSKTRLPTTDNLIAHIFLIFNYSERSYFFTINAVFWSLAIEAQFYLVLPVVVWLATRLVGRAGWAPLVATVLGFYLVGLVMRGVEYHLTPDSLADEPRFWSVLAYLDLFGAGMLVALLKPVLGARLREAWRPRWWLILVGVAIFLASNLWSDMVAPGGWQSGRSVLYTVGFPVAICLGIALVLLSMVSWPDGRFPVLSWKPLVWVGTISYSIYLYHIGVQYALLLVFGRMGWDLGPTGMLVFSLGALVPTLAVSAILFSLVEQPAMRWGARYSFHKTASSVTTE